VIWKFTDQDDDGVSDRREVFFDGKTLTGCANDLHGPYAGRDGWIYWCKGAFAPQTYERPGRAPLETKAAHIFRARVDGTGIEPVMTGGMDNPVDVVFTPTGERIFTTTFLVHPGAGLRDGLIHAIYGGVYGKVHNVLDGHPRTGDVMPVLVHMGPAAPCGLTLLDSSAWGADFQGNLFACSFNMHKVTRHVLEPSGASYATRDEDFLSSDNLDFHPTDVVEDADGSLIVVNTGGWYKLCCPTSQLWKPDILGGIYRVRRVGMPTIEDPRGLSIRWADMAVEELPRYLDDLRPAVRNRAIVETARRGTAAVRVLAEVIRNPTRAYVSKRLSAVWSLNRIDAPAARLLVRDALRDLDPQVRHAALSSVSLWRDREAAERLLEVLAEPSAAHQRVAAEALGRIGATEAVPALLAAAADPRHSGDRVREHSLIYALIEIGDVAATRRGLESAAPGTRRAALVALDQIPGAGLAADQVSPLLNSPVAMLRETASWLVNRHPEWGGALADYFADRLGHPPETAEGARELTSQLTLFSGQPSVQDLLARAAVSGSAAARAHALQAMRESALKELPASWVAALIAVLAESDSQAGHMASLVFRSVAVPKSDLARAAASLIDFASRGPLEQPLRLDVLAAVPGGVQKVDEPLLEFLLSGLRDEESLVARSAAADVLSKARLSAEQLMRVAEVLPAVGPLEVDRLLSAFDQSQEERVGMALVAALERSSALANLRADSLRVRLGKFGPAVEQAGARLYAALNVDLEKQRSRLQELLEGLKEGDVRRGQAVFHSARTACIVCHQMGYLGGNIGPDLTRIADVRNERDLLESIVFPSASFVRSYEPIVIATKDGQAVAGLVRKELPDALLVATGAKTEVRVARDNIEEIRPGNVSIMPSGLDQQLTTQELADLIAFLRAKK
jgi:putative heme-binding domain-containing protein